MFERRQRRCGLGHKERIAWRQSGNEIRIDGEIVGFDVTGPAGPSVARERLIERKLAAPGDSACRIVLSRSRGGWIEPEGGGRVIDKADLAM